VKGEAPATPQGANPKGVGRRERRQLRHHLEDRKRHSEVRPSTIASWPRPRGRLPPSLSLPRRARMSSTNGHGSKRAVLSRPCLHSDQARSATPSPADRSLAQVRRLRRLRGLRGGTGPRTQRGEPGEARDGPCAGPSGRRRRLGGHRPDRTASREPAYHYLLRKESRSTGPRSGRSNDRGDGSPRAN
jgi:hypothetical protein